MFFAIGSAALDEIYKNVYLLNVSTLRRYSALLWWKKSDARYCQRPSGISLGNSGWLACAALYVVQTLQCSAMSASIPCQKILFLTRCCNFSTPLW